MDNLDSLNPSTDDFASMFESSPAADAMIEGKVIPATVISVESDFVVVDIGLKTEGRIPAREFALEETPPVPGAIVEVFLDRIENALGDAMGKKRGQQDSAEQKQKGSQVCEDDKGRHNSGKFGVSRPQQAKRPLPHLPVHHDADMAIDLVRDLGGIAQRLPARDQ